MRYGKLTLYVGPMFAGKSSRLLLDYKASSDVEPFGKLLVKPEIDNRYADDKVVTHDKVSEPCFTIKKLNELPLKGYFRKLYKAFEQYKERDSDSYFRLYIDECHFFEDLVPSIKHFLSLGIDVICAGLDVTSTGDVFKNMEGAFGLADKIVKLRGRCQFCMGHSKYTLRKFSDDREVLVGGEESYIPVCGSCFDAITSGRVSLADKLKHSY